MIFSKNPKLSVEKMLVFGALGLYVFKHIQLQRSGQLSGEPDLLLKIDKQKLFDHASKMMNMNPAQRTLLEGLYDHMMQKKEDV